MALSILAPVLAPVLGPVAGRPAATRGPLALLRRWMRLRRERAALATLDPRLLQDIGVDRAAAAAEAARPFWDAPAGR